MDQLGLSSGIIVGQSMGGMNAITFASRFPDRVSALVLVEAGPFPRETGARRILDFMAADDELDSVEAFVDRALAFNPQRDSQLLRRSLLFNLRMLDNGRWTWKYDRRFRHATSEDARRRRYEDGEAALSKIDCPVLFVRGGRSDVFSDEDAARIAASLPDGRWVVVPDAGHNVQGDNPRGLVEAIRSFLGRPV
jgi:pimeloyl-ACP methyl ester carboxylesterase